MEQVNYVQAVPNSHSFGSLANIIAHYNYERMRDYKKASKESLREYFLIGFKNTKKRGYEIQQFGERRNDGPVFLLIQNILKYLNKPDFDLKEFVDVLQNTLYNNIDLKCKIKMERKEVYDRIDTERQYQDLRWTPRREKNGTPDEEKPIAEWINYMEFHLAKAKEAVYFLNDKEALAEVRKVTALGVRCMELHGCPEREIPEELKNNA